MSEIWSNWARDQRCAPAQVARPSSEDELASVVAGATAAGRSLRAVGAGHSFTDIACTDGVQVDLSRMSRLLHVDPVAGTATVEAGITLHELGPQLAEHGLALQNQGDIDTQTLAGACATATHGTGLEFPNLSAPALAMRLVLASGEIVEATQESDSELLAAARVSVGALGIVSSITLRCAPLYTLTRHDRVEPLADVLDQLPERAEGNDHFEFFTFPYTDVGLTRTSQRSLAPPPAGRSAGWQARLQETLVENWVLDVICRTGRRVPRATPALNRLLTSALSDTDVSERAYKVYASRRDVRFTEMEYAIPRDCAREAIERVLALVHRRRLPILFPLEVRFAAGDDAFLSTAYGRESCYIAVHQYTGMEFESYFRAVEAIMDEYGGRPHWGKRHYLTAAALRTRYPEWDRFQAVRERVDPTGAFTNDYVRRTLGPVGSTVLAQ